MKPAIDLRVAAHHIEVRLATCDDDVVTREPDNTDDESVDHARAAEPEEKDVSSAYQRLGVDQPSFGLGLKDIAGASKFSAGDILKNISSAHKIGAGDVVKNILPDWKAESESPVFSLPQNHPPLEIDIPILAQDDSPRRTADATEQMAQRLDDMHAVTVDLARLTATNLQLTEVQHAASERLEVFSRRMTVASLVISVASLAAAIVAIVVTVSTTG